MPRQSFARLPALVRYSAALVHWLPLARFAAAGFVVAVALVELAAGCGPQCRGVLIDGKCQATCHDEACPLGNRCLDNACRPACAGASDCLVGQSCGKVITDYGTTGSYCIDLTPSVDVLSGGEGQSCGSSQDCAQRYGYRCIAGTCHTTCEVHGHCASKGSCTGSATDTEGNAVHTCEPDGFPRGPGQFGTSCPNQTECDADHDFGCFGVGPGDIDAYCTKRFCTSDAECPPGSECHSERSRLRPCDRNNPCGFTGIDPNSPDCVASSNIGPGKQYTCGASWLVVHACERRRFCSPCESDVDCLGEPNQVCAADESGAKICTTRCDVNLSSCPWGASASCAVWDESLGAPTCAHRFGSCRGTGQSCEPCVGQEDCPNGWCSEDQFTGERFCVDQSVSCSCADGSTYCVGGGCPETPGGSLMTCVSGYCFGAQTDPTQPSKGSCWPQ